MSTSFLRLTCKMGSSFREKVPLFFSVICHSPCLPGALTLWHYLINVCPLGPIYTLPPSPPLPGILSASAFSQHSSCIIRISCLSRFPVKRALSPPSSIRGKSKNSIEFVYLLKGPEGALAMFSVGNPLEMEALTWGSQRHQKEIRIGRSLSG